MNRLLTDRILPIATLMAFEISALVVAVQGFIYLRSGVWPSISLGDVLERMGFPAPPVEWMNGSVYDLAWNEPLALTALLLGLIAATYAAIGRYERDEAAEPAFVYP